MLAGIDVQIRDEIAARNEAFMACFAAGDSRGISLLYTEDGQVMPPNSENLVGRAAIAQMWQGPMDAGVAGVKLEISEVHDAEQFAYEVSRYQMLSKDEQVIDHGKYIIVWKKVDDSWFIYRDIWNSSMPAT